MVLASEPPAVPLAFTVHSFCEAEVWFYALLMSDATRFSPYQAVSSVQPVTQPSRNSRDLFRLCFKGGAKSAAAVEIPDEPKQAAPKIDP